MDKLVLKNLTRYNICGFSEILSSVGEDKDEIANDYIRSALRDPGIVYQHLVPNRKNRDVFFEKLLEILKAHKCFKSVDFLENLSQVIVTSEILFDEIGTSIDQCAVSKLSIEEQCWSHIRRAENECYDIKLKVDKTHNDKNADFLLTGSSLVKDDNGHVFSADSVNQKIVEYLTLILKMLAYKNKWYADKSDYILFPDVVDITDDQIYLAGSTQFLAHSWTKLESISTRSLLFGGSIREYDKSTMPKDLVANNNSFKKLYHFVRNECEYEELDRISNDRLYRRLFQNYMEIIRDTNILEKVVSDVTQIKSLKDGKYICFDEGQSLLALCEILSFDVYNDIAEYSGLTIVEWVRGYACLKYLLDKKGTSRNGHVFERAEVEECLKLSGLLNNKPALFMQHASFGTKSRDLFDCPLLQINNGKIFLFSNAFYSSSIPIIVLSRLSSLDNDIDKKGHSFENRVIEKINSYGYECKNLKFKRAGKEYEYDAIFIMEDKLFVLECKNRGLSGYNPVLSFRKQSLYKETSDQLSRLVDGLITYPDAFQERFGRNLSDFEIIPIALNCLPFSWRGKYKDIYIQDFSSLNRFFSSNDVGAVVSYKKCGISFKERISIKKQWSGDRPSAKDFISHINYPVQLREYEGLSKKIQVPGFSSDESVFIMDTYEIDQEKMQQVRAELIKKCGIDKKRPKFSDLWRASKQKKLTKKARKNRSSSGNTSTE